MFTNPPMARERLSGFPYESKKEGGKTVLRFFPKSENAKNQNSIVFVLSLDKAEREKLKKIIS